MAFYRTWVSLPRGSSEWPQFKTRRLSRDSGSISEAASRVNVSRVLACSEWPECVTVAWHRRAMRIAVVETPPRRASGALVDGKKDRIDRKTQNRIRSARCALRRGTRRSRSIASQRSARMLPPAHPPGSSPRPRRSSLKRFKTTQSHENST
jgi:hypothetical protein